jgi:hypothetical protein
VSRRQQRCVQVTGEADLERLQADGTITPEDADALRDFMAFLRGEITGAELAETSRAQVGGRAGRSEAAVELHERCAGAEKVGVVDAERKREGVVPLVGDGTNLGHDTQSCMTHHGRLVEARSGGAGDAEQFGVEGGLHGAILTGGGPSVASSPQGPGGVAMKALTVRRFWKASLHRKPDVRLRVEPGCSGLRAPGQSDLLHTGDRASHDILTLGPLSSTSLISDCNRQREADCLPWSNHLGSVSLASIAGHIDDELKVKGVVGTHVDERQRQAVQVPGLLPVDVVMLGCDARELVGPLVRSSRKLKRLPSTVAGITSPLVRVSRTSDPVAANQRSDDHATPSCPCAAVHVSNGRSSRRRPQENA